MDEPSAQTNCVRSGHRSRLRSHPEAILLRWNETQHVTGSCALEKKRIVEMLDRWVGYEFVTTVFLLLGTGTASEFPCLRVFPGDVNRVVEVEKQSFAAIKEAEAKKIVVDECRQRAQNYVEETESASAAG
jgi:hypothetical protein